MTPLLIEVLLYCYYCPDPHPRKDSVAIEDALETLFKKGLIDSKHRTTPMGDAHVIQICKLPLPESAWVDFTGKIIERN